MPSTDPAATVLLLRPAAEGFEVLMVERSPVGAFGSMVVFPGGRVDDVDVPPGLARESEEAHRNAALRELAEETGIVLVAAGAVSSPGLKAGAFYEWIAARGESPAVDSLVLLSRWITPEPAPKRFDTLFYLAVCDIAPEVSIDRDELVSHLWVTPRRALAMAENGSLAMVQPTIAHLRWLSGHGSIAAAFTSARGAELRMLAEPRRVEDGSLVPIHLPGDPP